MQHNNLYVTHSVSNGKSRRVTTLTEDGHPPIEIFHEFDEIIQWSDDTLLDGHILCVLAYAMSRGKPLKVHGTVSHGILRNIDDLQTAWLCWRPGRYVKIEIIPDKIVNARRLAGKDKAIAAFSGGIDASFTAIRHGKDLSEDVRYPVSDVLLVHGFDVALANTHYFDGLVNRVNPLLESLNLRLHTIRTNSKELKIQDWDDSHAMELAACLHMFSEEFQFGLIGSSEPYEALVFPYASNPATDHLLSGDRLSIIHDGAGYSRTRKLEEVVKYPIALRTLKFCWAKGADESENCGKCEKCIRTHVNFLAVGHGNPPCFPQPFDLDLVKTLPIYTEGQMAELVSIVHYAEENKLSGEWLDVLNKRLSKGLTVWRHPWPKRIIYKSLDIMGLRPLAKKAWHKIRSN